MSSSELKLTPINECATDAGDELNELSTVGILEYGLRQGCLDSEYHISLRLQEMRELAFAQAQQLLEEGYPISDTTLKLLDITREVKTEKRFFKSS